jgi:hypothetical protein
MNWSDSLKVRIVNELKGYDVYFSAEEVPSEINLPEQWRGFGFSNRGGEGMPAEWANFAELLPWVSAWLDKCVLGTVFAVSDRPYLMYVYSENGDLWFYMGGVPLELEQSVNDRIQWMPRRLKAFYTNLHNGFGFYIGCTMGPSRIEDFVSIKDLCDEEYPALPDMTGVFSSGAGDYLSLTKPPAEGEALIWWHEEPEMPTRNIDLWDVMDSWMSIFLENSDSNESVLV